MQIVRVKWEQNPRGVIVGWPSSRSRSSLLKCEEKKPGETGQRTEVSVVNDRSGEQGGRRGRQRRDM